MALIARPFVFFDKDGTLVENVPHNVDPARVRLVPGAIRALHMLRDAGFRFAVVSNQPGVARGLFDEEGLRRLIGHFRTMLSDFDINVDAFFYCPHHPAGRVPEYAVECLCRKPKPGLILRGARELDADMRRSWFVGDILDDVEAGNQAGCRTVLIDNGNETEWRRSALRMPDITVPGIVEAAQIILYRSVGWRRRRGTL